jgi:hypothetical protein
MTEEAEGAADEENEEQVFFICRSAINPGITIRLQSSAGHNDNADINPGLDGDRTNRRPHRAKV